MMKQNRTLAIVVGVGLLLWWWMRSRQTAAAGVASTPTSASMMLDSVLAKVLPDGSGAAASNPISGFLDFITGSGTAIAQAEAGTQDPRPAFTGWIWTGGDSGTKGKYVPRQEWDRFDKTKCEAPGCDAYGRLCTQGFDC